MAWLGVGVLVTSRVRCLYVNSEIGQTKTDPHKYTLPVQHMGVVLHERVRPVGAQRDKCYGEVRQPQKLLVVLSRKLLPALKDRLEGHGACPGFHCVKCLQTAV